MEMMVFFAWLRWSSPVVFCFLCWLTGWSLTYAYIFRITDLSFVKLMKVVDINAALLLTTQNYSTQVLTASATVFLFHFWYVFSSLRPINTYIYPLVQNHRRMNRWNIRNFSACMNIRLIVAYKSNEYIALFVIVAATAFKTIQ